MRLRIVLVAVLFGACFCPGPPPMPQPPEQPGDCPAPASGAPLEVEVGVGEEAYATLARGVELAQIYGGQGGSHVWVAVRARGFQPAGVSIEVVAKDAYAPIERARGTADAIRLNQLPGRPAGDCDFHGIPLFVNAGAFEAGFVEITATVKEASGRSATGTQFAWLGTPQPSCVPDDAVAASVEPLLHASEYSLGAEALAIADGSTIEPPGYGPDDEFILGVTTTGFAGSATAFTIEVREPGAGDEVPPIQTVSSGDMSPYSSLSVRDGRCVAPRFARLVADESLLGRPLELRFSADDGLGHEATAVRTVTLRRRAGQ